MPFISVERGEIYYEVNGTGFPVLLFAPGFLNSCIEGWHAGALRRSTAAAWPNPIPRYARHFKVITLDVRNAGRSWAEVGPDYDWPCYTADHVTLLKALGIEKCHVMGACIGVSFALALAQAAPGRVKAMVLQNPAGASDTNRPAIEEMFGQWAARLSARPDVSSSAVHSVGPRMFGGDFVFSVTREAVARRSIPTLLMPGDDEIHPAAISQELARLTRAEILAPWSGASYHAAATQCVRHFLLKHVPGRKTVTRASATLVPARARRSV